MPTVDANGCKMFYEIDDYTDPWTSDKRNGLAATRGRTWHPQVLVPLGSGALAREYRVHTPRYAGSRAVHRQHHRLTTNGRSMNWPEGTCSRFMDAMGLERVHYLG